MATRIICAYGDSGTGKSEAALALFLDLQKQWRQKDPKSRFIMRAYVGDGSLATYLDTGLVINPPDEPVNPEGLIELCVYQNYPWPLTVTNQIAEGWFPKDGQPGAALVPPAQQANYGRVRLWVYEGLQVMGDYIMGGPVKGSLAEQAARGVKIGPDAAIRLVEQDYSIDPMTGAVDTTRPVAKTGTGNAYGSNGTAHYGLAQTHMKGVIERTKALPGWIFWTTHERAAKDKSGFKQEGFGKEATVAGGAPTIIGPAVVGDALTATIQKTFNELLHFQKATKVVQATVPDGHSQKRVNKVEMEHRIYTREHLDPDLDTSLRYRALVRSAEPTDVKEFYTGTAAEGSGIVKLYEDLTKAALRKRQALMAAAGLKGEVA